MVDRAFPARIDTGRLEHVEQLLQEAAPTGSRAELYSARRMICAT